ncbi:nitroreductase/quinone reductase family protein [Streptomyces sp. NPDC050804]|uniref:nitroreductase/quinone reductase family protein n=1 Tax=Streptomyces sp. NPDC050804 TaxID=3154745 RepID=UPI00342D9B34
MPMSSPHLSFNQSIIDEFRANAGKVGGPFEGGDLLLLTTTGARSATEHTVPLGFVRADGLLLVVGSAGGADRHPAWYHNLLARPMVRVEIGTEAFEAIAVPAEGARRDLLFEQIVRTAPGYGDYQARTTRILPVVALERSGPEPGEGPERVVDLAGKLREIHTWLRAQLRQVRAEADAHFADAGTGTGPDTGTGQGTGQGTGTGTGPGAGTGPRIGLGLQLRQHCLAFCQSLEFHHSSEDAHMFPGLARHYPHLRDVFDRLGEEHRTLARVQAELLTLLGGIATADPRRFRAELDRMTRELHAHLDREEESLLPVLAGIPLPPSPSPGTTPGTTG